MKGPNTTLPGANKEDEGAEKEAESVSPTAPGQSGFPQAEAPKMDKVGENICNACDKLFNNNKDLDNHVHAKHNDEVVLLPEPCTVCHKEFTTKKHMENHKRRCLQPICPTCGEIFKDKSDLKKHKGECEVLKDNDNRWKIKAEKSASTGRGAIALKQMNASSAM